MCKCGSLVPACFLVSGLASHRHWCHRDKSESETGFASNSIRWMMSIPAGGMFIASGLMHTAFAERTAENIGWKSNGFQYEVFVSFGIGAAVIYAIRRVLDRRCCKPHLRDGKRTESRTGEHRCVGLRRGPTAVAMGPTRFDLREVAAVHNRGQK